MEVVSTVTLELQVERQMQGCPLFCAGWSWQRGSGIAAARHVSLGSHSWDLDIAYPTLPLVCLSG